MDFISSGEEGEVKDDGSEAGGDTGKMRSHPLVSLSIINPDEIPDVPKNRFLYRAGPENNEEEGRADRGRERTRSTVRAYTKSGRKVKGRGSLVRLHYPDSISFSDFILFYSIVFDASFPLGS